MTKNIAVHDALTGLIGDNRRTISSTRLYNRVVDQCKRHGIAVPSWARFVDLARQQGVTFPNLKTAKLPKRKRI